jgi:hypothetical protein
MTLLPLRSYSHVILANKPCSHVTVPLGSLQAYPAVLELPVLALIIWRVDAFMDKML